MTGERQAFLKIKMYPDKKKQMVCFWVGLFLGLILFAGSGPPARAREITDSNSKPPNIPITTRNDVHLPLPSIFGAQMNGVIDESQGLSQAVNGGVYWVRFDAFDWRRIEPAQTFPSTFHWKNVAEDSLVRAAQNGLQVIAVVKYTPGYRNTPAQPVAR